MPLCSYCNQPNDDPAVLWPEWHQLCWETECSRSWWATCGGVFEEVTYG